TYMMDDLLVVVLEETFTKAERTLVGRGETDAIKQIRRRFQQEMADEFTAIVEQATGRKVRAFLSETNLEADVAVEIFLLGEKRTDMGGFEQS
ncbi:MAG: Na-translocating system protein MpsC family protein, partial [Gaiellaceae bacterium]